MCEAPNYLCDTLKQHQINSHMSMFWRKKKQMLSKSRRVCQDCAYTKTGTLQFSSLDNYRGLNSPTFLDFRFKMHFKLFKNYLNAPQYYRYGDSAPPYLNVCNFLTVFSFKYLKSSDFESFRTLLGPKTLQQGEFWDVRFKIHFKLFKNAPNNTDMITVPHLI